MTILMALRAFGLVHLDSLLSESEAATHPVLRLCSFQDFFKKASDVSEAAGEAKSASQQEPAVIVLLPLLLGLGKVRLNYNAKHCACRVQWSISMCWLCEGRPPSMLVSASTLHIYTPASVSVKDICMLNHWHQQQQGTPSCFHACGCPQEQAHMEVRSMGSLAAGE